MKNDDISGYRWHSASLTPSHEYLLPELIAQLNRSSADKITQKYRRVFELGCGNGSVANFLVQQGWNVTGVDPSLEGIAHANKMYPNINLYEGSAYDDLVSRFGQFPVVTSLEVVEHVYFPRRYAATLFSLLEPGGCAIVSTP